MPRRVNAIGAGWWLCLRVLSLLLVAASAGCGYLVQRASVSRQFRGRFQCAGAKVQRVSGGYHVEGCGQSAEYMCMRTYQAEQDASYRDEDDRRGAAVTALVLGTLLAGSDEHCRLVYAQPSSRALMPTISSAPQPVRRVKRAHGELLLNTRILFAGGYLSARAKPIERPAHALLIVHGIARLPIGSCRAELFHDGVPVLVLDQVRVDPYEVQLLVPIAALLGAERAVRFSGSVCGLDFDLDPAGRATLGLFAIRFQEELARAASLTAGASGP